MPPATLNCLKPDFPNEEKRGARVLLGGILYTFNDTRRAAGRQRPAPRIPRTWLSLAAVLVIRYPLPGTALGRLLLTAGLPRRLRGRAHLACGLLHLPRRLGG